jgi:hypothetical protein
VVLEFKHVFILLIALILPGPLWAEQPESDLELERQTLSKIYYLRSRNIYVAEIHQNFKRQGSNEAERLGEDFKIHRFEVLHRHDSRKEIISRRPRDMQELRSHPYAQLFWPQDADSPKLRIGSKTWSVSFLKEYGSGNGQVFRGEEGDLVLVWEKSAISGTDNWGPKWFFIDSTKEADFFYLNELGFEAYNAGDLAEAERLFNESHQLYEPFRFSGFNLLCTRALLGQSWQESMEVIASVLSPGSGLTRFREKILRDADLTSWHKDPAFLVYVNSLN